MINAWAYLIYNIFVGHYYLYWGWDRLFQKPPLVVPVACLYPSSGSRDNWWHSGPYRWPWHAESQWSRVLNKHIRDTFQGYGCLLLGVASRVSLWWIIRLCPVLSSVFYCFGYCSENIFKALAPFGGCEEEATSTRAVKCNPFLKEWVGLSSVVWTQPSIPDLFPIYTVLGFVFGFQFWLSDNYWLQANLYLGLQDFDCEDPRSYCFSVLANHGKSHIFSVELGSELAVWEKAFQRATFMEVQRPGVSMLWDSHSSHYQLWGNIWHLGDGV